MKKLVFLVVMALLVGAVHAVTMPWAACAPTHATTASTSHHHVSTGDSSQHSHQPSPTQHSSAGAHSCCAGMCPQSEPWVFQALATTQPPALSPVLGADLGLSSAIFKPPKSSV